MRSHTRGWMGHPKIDNKTPFAFEAIHLADEEARPVVVTVVRATYDIVGNHLAIAEEQAPVPVAGVLHGKDAGTSSYRFEPEFALEKVATDVALVGHAWAPYVGAVESEVSLQVGPVSKAVAVVGERVWVSAAGSAVMTHPRPFEAIPLVYERAFGGWDPTAGTPEKPAFEPRNPVGTGYRSRWGSFEEGVRLPNFEDPDDRVGYWGQGVRPAGFGFLSTHWQPRAALAGTYDDAWMSSRMPRLPHDFDPRFWNAASPGLVAVGLRGDETVAVRGASPRGLLAFRLPGVPPPVCRVSRALDPDAVVVTRLDTVVIDTDAHQVYLTWRGRVTLRNGPHDVRAVAIDAG